MAPLQPGDRSLLSQKQGAEIRQGTLLLCRKAGPLFSLRVEPSKSKDSLLPFILLLIHCEGHCTDCTSKDFLPVNTILKVSH